MSQSTIFPLRFGLQLPRPENVQVVEVYSEGGLDLTQSIIENRPGCATVLTNYEACLRGGYRRINGFTPYVSATVAGEGQILGVVILFNYGIIAARKDVGTNTYSLYGGLSWAKISTGTLNYSAGMILEYDQYNWNGKYKVVITDGVNPAYTWDGATFTLLNATGSAADPKFCKVHLGYLFVGGYSSNRGAVKISAPLAETDWAPVDGAAEIVVGDTLTGLNVWQSNLIIFGKKTISQISGNSTNITSTTPFTLKTITDKIGCIEGRTIKEIDGDLIFLAPDGIRTISGTEKIGETETGSISRPIQQIVFGINTSKAVCNAVVVHKKTQYRLFYPDASVTEASCKGIIGSIRRFRDGHEGWEWGELQGIKPACTTSGFLSNNNEYIIHGGYDGVVYQQEVGNTFNGANINESYTTVPLELGDASLRKVPHRVTIFFVAEGNSSNVNFQVIYDYNDSTVQQPAARAIANTSTTYVTYDSGFKYDQGNKYNAENLSFVPVLHRQLVQGSGFLVQLNIAQNTASAPYVIQGFLIEYFPAGRR